MNSLTVLSLKNIATVILAACTLQEMVPMQRVYFNAKKCCHSRNVLLHLLLSHLLLITNKKK